MAWRAFTLIEMLVVVAVIIILIAIIIPVLGNAKQSGYVTVCGSNERQLMTAFLTFASDHMGSLPGNQWDSIKQHPDPAPAWMRDWLLGDNPNQGDENAQWLAGPQCGTIFPYVNKNPKLYLCPAYYMAAPLNSGLGSNGRFDYSAFIAFAGAKVSSVKTLARFHSSPGSISVPSTSNTYIQNLLTPIICEEEVQGGINGGNVEGGHCNSDRLGHAHFGGSNYASIDGSVQRFNEPMNQNAWNWESLAPSGKWASLGPVPIPGWAWWQRQ